jgi:hypothetical protein
MQQYVKTHTAQNYKTKKINQKGDVWALTQHPNVGDDDDDVNDVDTNTTAFLDPCEEHN